MWRGQRDSNLSADRQARDLPRDMRGADAIPSNELLAIRSQLSHVILKNGGDDGTRTRDLLRDRQTL